MITSRDSLLAGASLAVGSMIGDAVFAQVKDGYVAARKAVGKRACTKCDDRGQVQSNLGGGNVDKLQVEGFPEVGWVQQGYVLCPDCVGESKEFRTAISQIKDGAVPWVKLAQKKIADRKKSGTLAEVEEKLKEERLPKYDTAFKLFSVKGIQSPPPSNGGTRLIANLVAHYRTATLTRGVIRAVVLRWGAKSTTRAADAVERSNAVLDKESFLTTLDLMRAVAATFDVKYREPLGFPPSFGSLPTFKNRDMPEGFGFHYLG
jgi:hypothetical protein